MLYQIIGPSFALDFSDNLINAIKKHASDFPLKELSKLLNIILSKLAIKESMIDQLPLELACVEYLLEQQTASSLESDSVSTEVNITTETPENSKPQPEVLLTLKNKWSQVVEDTKPFNHSLSMILKTSHPLKIDGDKVIIGLEFDFHLEQLDKPPIKNHLVEIFEKILHHKFKIEFEIDKNFKENHQNFKGKDEKEVSDVLDTFGGEMV